MDAGSGSTPFSRLAPASLNETSLTLRENVDQRLSQVWISGWGMGALVEDLGRGASSRGQGRLESVECRVSSVERRLTSARARAIFCSCSAIFSFKASKLEVLSRLTTSAR